jgi:hypothetical protein
VHFLPIEALQSREARVVMMMMYLICSCRNKIGPKELRNALSVQVIVLRLWDAQSSSSSSGIEACRRECQGWPSNVLDMQSKICVAWHWCNAMPRGCGAPFSRASL